jgi:hypothetical protein
MASFILLFSFGQQSLSYVEVSGSIYFKLVALNGLATTNSCGFTTAYCPIAVTATVKQQPAVTPKL